MPRRVVAGAVEGAVAGAVEGAGTGAVEGAGTESGTEELLKLCLHVGHVLFTRSHRCKLL